MTPSNQIVCPHCNTVNRIPSHRMNENPICGQCKQELFTGHPTEASESSFAINIRRNDIPVLVDFWAPWCGPCKTMIPVFKHVAEQLEPHIRLVKVDTEQEKTIAAHYNIRSIPTLALFKNGKELARQSGVMSADDLINWVRSYI